MIDFKIGQKVWSWNWGWGVVSRFDPDDAYSVLVKYDSRDEEDDNDCWYTANGAEYKGGQRTLFFKEVPIPEYALVPPVEEVILNTGDIVLFHDGTLGYVETYSGSIEKTFSWYDKVPQSLDEAFGSTSSFKKAIKKVVGNIND